MRKILFVSFISIFFLLPNSIITMAYEKEIKSLSSAMSENIVKAGKKSIAVVDFTDLQGNVTELGRFIAEEFSVALAGAGKGFEVVDRTHLKTILKEHKLAITGVIDPTTAKKLGQVAGVDALVTGSITPFGDSVRISVKLLDTATAKVIGASSGDIAKTKAIEELLGRGVETVTPSGQTVTPSSPKPQPKAEYRVVVDDFIFEAKACERSERYVKCFISVVNDSQETRRIVIHTRGTPWVPLLIDEFGNSYSPTGIWFGGRGGQETTFPSPIEYRVPAKLPMNLTLLYKGIIKESYQR
jgi:TolB-like protein